MDWPTETQMTVDDFAAASGDVFASFMLQDSGCRSYGVDVDGECWFLKGAVVASAVPSLERAVVIHRAVSHTAIIPMRYSVRGPMGPLLVFPWVAADPLYGAGPPGGASQRLDPTGPHARFRRLPLLEVIAAFDAILDAHIALTCAGFVAVDLYDGCFMYDFDASRMWLCDLDEYRRGPFVVEADRLPGSLRFMAPEELRSGGVIDERTTVFNLGRAGLVLFDEGEVGTSFRGPSELAAIAVRASRDEPDDRYATVQDFVDEWRIAAAGVRA